MKWNSLEADISKHEIHSIINQIGMMYGLAFINKKENYLLLCYKNCWNNIINHLKPHKVEMGGLIIGKIYENEKFDKIIISLEDIVISQDHKSTTVSLQMGSEIWSVANSKISKGQAVVGWYHSHPNLGAFFSGTDIRNQKANFNSSFHFGLVVDPFRNEYAIFRGADSKPIHLSNFFIGDNHAWVALGTKV